MNYQILTNAEKQRRFRKKLKEDKGPDAVYIYQAKDSIEYQKKKELFKVLIDPDVKEDLVKAKKDSGFTWSEFLEYILKGVKK